MYSYQGSPNSGFQISQLGYMFRKSKSLTDSSQLRGLESIDFQKKLENIHQTHTPNNNISVDIGISSLICLLLPLLMNLSTHELYDKFMSPRLILTLSILLICFTTQYLNKTAINQKQIFLMFYLLFVITLQISNIITILYKRQDHQALLYLVDVFKNDFTCILIYQGFAMTRFNIDNKYMNVLGGIVTGFSLLFILICTFITNLNLSFVGSLTLQYISYSIAFVIFIYVSQQKYTNEEKLKDFVATELNKESDKINVKLRKMQKHISKTYSNLSPILASQADQLLKKIKYFRQQLIIKAENPESEEHKTIYSALSSPKKNSEKDKKRLSKFSLTKNEKIQQENKKDEKSNNEIDKQIKQQQQDNITSQSVLLQQVENYEVIKESTQKQDKWNLTVDDIDQIVNGLVMQQGGIWLPNILNKQLLTTQSSDSILTKEGQDFVMNHYTSNQLDENILPPIHNIPSQQPMQSKRKQKFQLDLDLQLTDYQSLLGQNILNKIGHDWNIDFFNQNKLSKGNVLYEFGCIVFKKYKIIDTLLIDNHVVVQFLKKVESYYAPKNPYHNSIHASDVANSVCFFLNNGLGSHLSNIELSCLIISGLVHDIGHPGLNNTFLVSTQSKQALIYNDQSVLENYHVSTFYGIMRIKECNILVNLNEKDWKHFRKVSIQVILDTDLQKHFVLVNKFKNQIAMEQFSMTDESHKLLALSIALKCADVGHGAKELKIHKLWSRRIVEEFYIQGDKEKQYYNNLTVTPLCNRETNIISKSQEGFLKCIALPLFAAWCEFFKSETIENQCLHQIKKNIEYWTSEITKEEHGNSLFLDETNDVLEQLQEYAQDSESAQIIQNFL